MSQAADIAFVSPNKIDENGVAVSTDLSEVDRRHVRLTTLRNAHGQHSTPKLRRQQDHENSFLLTRSKAPINDLKSKPLTTTALLLQICRHRPTSQSVDALITPAFDKFRFKNGSSLDQAINKPQ